MFYYYIIIAVIAYLLGSISSSVLLSQQMFRTDIRTKGSGNAGATNVARVFGLPAGLLTLFCDALKAVAAMLIGRWLGGLWLGEHGVELGLTVAGAACLIGHCWPFFFRFKGGKGVTVGAVVALMLDWRVFLIMAAAFFIVFLFSRTISLCSIISAILFPIGCLIFGDILPAVLLAAFAAVLVVFQHRGNIKRLLNHEEPKFDLHSKK